jgi:signal transduction histidine kinase
MKDEESTKKRRMKHGRIRVAETARVPKGKVTPANSHNLLKNKQKQRKPAQVPQSEQSIMFDIANIFLTVKDDRLYDKILFIILQALKSKNGVFAYLDEDKNLVIPTQSHYSWEKYQITKKTIILTRKEWADKSWTAALSEKKAICSNDTSADAASQKNNIDRFITVPLLVSSQVIGLLQVANKTTDYGNRDVKLLQAIVAYIAPILAARLETLTWEKARQQVEMEIRLWNEELEKRVRERTVQLEAANKEMESFSYSVSHDLRAPLRAINGYSRILQEDHRTQLNDEGSRILGVIHDEALRMSRMLDNLVEFSRLTRQPLRVEEIEMTEFARQIYEHIFSDLTDRPVDFHLNLLPKAFGDRTLLIYVWSHLINNAFKFSRTRETTEIEIGAVTQDDENIYYIKDNGIGFDMKYVGKLFTIFQRLHPENIAEGSGVGLALVQRIIHRHGGRIWVESQVDHGTTFFFTLPAKMEN